METRNAMGIGAIVAVGVLAMFALISFGGGTDTETDGDVAGGDQPVKVQQGEIPEIAGKETQTAPKTQPKTQTDQQSQTTPKTEAKVDKPVLSKTESSAPADVAVEFFNLIKIGEYRNAMINLDPSISMTEERLFNVYSGIEFKDITVKKEELGEEVERLSKGKSIKYKTSTVQIQIEYIKNNEKRTSNAFLDLIEMDGTWKISSISSSLS